MAQAMLENKKTSVQLAGELWQEVRSSWCMLMVPVTLLCSSLETEKFIWAWLLAALLVLLALGDYRYGLLYDSLVLAVLVAGTGPLYTGLVSMSEALAGSLAGGGLFYLLRVLSRGGLGLGDVKLLAALGPWLGWQGMIICLLLSSSLGLCYGSYLLLQGKITRQSALPFGPWLAAGALVAFAWGDAGWAYLEAWLW